jgi:hypothetical protein
MSTPAINLSHTPSIYYALGYFISSCILVAINRRRLSFKKLLAVSLLYYVCLSGFMYATDGVDDLFYVITMLLVFGLIFLYLFTAIDANWKKPSIQLSLPLSSGNLQLPLNGRFFI